LRPEVKRPCGRLLVAELNHRHHRDLPRAATSNQVLRRRHLQVRNDHVARRVTITFNALHRRLRVIHAFARVVVAPKRLKKSVRIPEVPAAEQDFHRYLPHGIVTQERCRYKWPSSPSPAQGLDAAVALINGEYASRPKPNPTWDDAIETMKRYMNADNLRPGTIQQYEIAAGLLKTAYPNTTGPDQISDQLRSFHLKRGKTRSAQMVRGFTPHRLVRWLEDQVVAYLKAHPKVRKFKLHNFRGTAMSRARMAGVSYDDAAVAFGCNPQTMRQHYIALDEVTISDRVMEKIQNGIEGELRENRPVSAEPAEKDLRLIVASPLYEALSEVRETGLEPAPGCPD
jgi:hypothetical protein